VSEKGFVDPKKSNRSGLSGLLETLFRRFKTLTHIVMIIPFYMLACAVIGFAAMPGLYTFIEIRKFAAANVSGPPWFFLTGFSIALAYFMYGMTMVFLVPAVNYVLVKRLKPWRGPYYSIEAIKWYIHNGATYILRYTFLELITPSPISNTFYSLMGMKLKRGAILNTTHISDPSLIEIGEDTTIGGSAVLIGHDGQSGFLVLAKTVIGRRVTIGLRAVIMGGVTIGDNAKVLANSVVLPRTVIPPGETWGGVPAKKIERSSATSVEPATDN
jgi:acetyltransferase-like isoleucine patch superfamily enzyme